MQTESKGPLGAPLLVSIVALDGGASVLHYGAATGLNGEFRADLRLREPTALLLRKRRTWFCAQTEGLEPRDQVIWPEEFLKLRDEIRAAARKNNTSWIILSVDPQGSCLPWQHLFSFADGAIGDYLVTLSPNLGWASLTSRSSRPLKRRDPIRLVCDSDDSMVVEARTLLEPLIAGDQPFNIGVVLGHGTLPSDTAVPPTVAIGQRVLDATDYRRLNSHEVIVMHSCWTAGGNPNRWAHGLLAVDLLGGPCRAVLAPVGLVSPKVISALQAELSRPQSSETLGARYLAAVRQHPGASLYNLLGMGSIEPVN